MRLLFKSGHNAMGLCLGKFKNYFLISQKNLQNNPLNTSTPTIRHILRRFKLGLIEGSGYIPPFEHNEITDRRQEITGICVDTPIIKMKTLKCDKITNASAVPQSASMQGCVL